jgi:hypothetical protein
MIDEHDSTPLKHALEHSEYDRADECQCNVRGNNAQLADESHGKPPWFTSQGVVTRKLVSGSRPEIVSLAALIAGSGSRVGPGDVVKKA